MMIVMLVQLALLLGSAIMVVVAAWRMSGGGGVSVLLLWALCPYIGFGIISTLCYARMRMRAAVAISALLSSLLMFALTSSAYQDAVSSTSSTAGLVFVFVPVWLVAGAAVLFGLGLLVGWLCGSGDLRQDCSRCNVCGYPLFGLPGPRCPECGCRFARREKSGHVTDQPYCEEWENSTAD